MAGLVVGLALLLASAPLAVAGVAGSTPGEDGGAAILPEGAPGVPAEPGDPGQEEQEEEGEQEDREQEDREERTIRARVQTRLDGPRETIEMKIHEVPVNPPSVAAERGELDDDELVLGVVVDGQPMAYPIRYLALVEVVNDQVGDTPVSPTW